MSEADEIVIESADNLSEACGPFKNTDRELWREREGDYYANSLHVTNGGGIGINVGGHVIVKLLKEWHALATQEETFAIARIATEAESLRRLVETENVTNKPKEYHAPTTEAAEAT